MQIDVYNGADFLRTLEVYYFDEEEGRKLEELNLSIDIDTADNQYIMYIDNGREFPDGTPRELMIDLALYKYPEFVQPDFTEQIEEHKFTFIDMEDGSLFRDILESVVGVG